MVRASIIIMALVLAAVPVQACEKVEITALKSVLGTTPKPVGPPGIAVIYNPKGWRKTAEESPNGQMLQEVIGLMTKDCPPPIPQEPQKFPLGDTVFMRHPGLLPAVDGSAGRILRAATIARSTNVAVQILRPMLSDDVDPIIRYRAALEIAYRIARTPDGMETDLAEAVRTARGLAPRGMEVDPTADLDFLAAHACRIYSQPLETCKAFADAAVAKDPYFVAARRFRLELLDVMLRRMSPADITERCETIVSEILLDIHNLLQDVENPSQRIVIADAMDGAAETGNAVLFLGASHVFATAGAQRKAAEAFSDAERSLAGAEGCPSLLLPHLDTFRKEMP